MILRTILVLSLVLAVVWCDYGSKPKSKVIFKQAGPSREYRWAGYTHHYPRSIPRPLIIHKWNPYKDPVYTASWVSHKPKGGGGHHGKHASKGHHGGGHSKGHGGHSKGHGKIPHGFGPPKPSSISGGGYHGGHSEEHISHETIQLPAIHLHEHEAPQGSGFPIIVSEDSGEFFNNGFVDSVELGPGHFNGDSHFGGSHGVVQQPYEAPNLVQPYEAPNAHRVVSSSVQVAQGGQIYPDLDPRVPNIPQVYALEDSIEHVRSVPIIQEEVVPLVVHPQSAPLPLENEGAPIAFNNNHII